MSLNINSWQDIPWLTVEQTVFRLQLRIYKASAKGKHEKMYKLQKLLISSYHAKYYAVRKVTQENIGKKTLSIDNVLMKTKTKRLALANRLTLDGKVMPILRQYIPQQDDNQCSLTISIIEDHCKQMLAYLALSPQWKAKFEEHDYGFKADRSMLNAIQGICLGIKRKPKWVLDVDIQQCFPTISHDSLLDKCKTYSRIRKQIRAWLKAGIMEDGYYLISKMSKPTGSVISTLLAQIALHGLRYKLDTYLNRIAGFQKAFGCSLTYVRYADDFLFMHYDRKVLEKVCQITFTFLKPLGLELNPIKTRIVHTLKNAADGTPPGFFFLACKIFQRKQRVRKYGMDTKGFSKRDYVTFIKHSSNRIDVYRKKLRETIRRYTGVKQEILIYRLNPLIRGWVSSKQTQISSKNFQALDSYVYKHLWNWARRRHPKMSKYKLKALYWHILGNNFWVFGVKKDKEIKLQIQKHSKINI
uniref:Putative reverse transcriptase/maturase n=1 Tax=Bulboplastis apyrenoidosa TaxID=1070855 RepID=A0A1Y9TM46_9RHOD|nr:putative reverse transcriptase/maturase [Bulboplastis apyrenoidosa]ARO90702.1 putative reverse transcriptase/maturase [Bulboplastis apyrenoidosa]